MSRWCLDTSACSRFRKGEPTVVGLLDRAEWVGVPAVVLGELQAGFLRGHRSRENVEVLLEFLENPAVEEIVVDAEVAEHYAALWDDLRRKGRPLPTNDVWIAACAARSGATVLTFDEHFRQVDRVGCLVLEEEDYPPPRRHSR